MPKYSDFQIPRWNKLPNDGRDLTFRDIIGRYEVLRNSKDTKGNPKKCREIIGDEWLDLMKDRQPAYKSAKFGVLVQPLLVLYQCLKILRSQGQTTLEQFEEFLNEPFDPIKFDRKQIREKYFGNE